MLFTSPDMDAFRWIGAPRPEIGMTLNTDGRGQHCPCGPDLAVARLFDTPIYLEGTFGAAAHNGYLTDAPAGRRNFGCRVNFYERFGVGTASERKRSPRR